MISELRRKEKICFNMKIVQRVSKKVQHFGGERLPYVRAEENDSDQDSEGIRA